MAKAWVDEEDHALWQCFECGPDVVVNGIPRRHGLVEKFPDRFLASFFNAFADQHLWRDKAKSGLECMNRVMQLRDKESARQRVLQRRDAADIQTAEAQFAAFLGRTMVFPPLFLLHTQKRRPRTDHSHRRGVQEQTIPTMVFPPLFLLHTQKRRPRTDHSL